MYKIMTPLIRPSVSESEGGRMWLLTKLLNVISPYHFLDVNNSDALWCKILTFILNDDNCPEGALTSIIQWFSTMSRLCIEQNYPGYDKEIKFNLAISERNDSDKIKEMNQRFMLSMSDLFDHGSKDYVDKLLKEEYVKMRIFVTNILMEQVKNPNHCPLVDDIVLQGKTKTLLRRAHSNGYELYNALRLREKVPAIILMVDVDDNYDNKLLSYAKAGPIFNDYNIARLFMYINYNKIDEVFNPEYIDILHECNNDTCREYEKINNIKSRDNDLIPNFNTSNLINYLPLINGKRAKEAQYLFDKIAFFDNHWLVDFILDNLPLAEVSDALQNTGKYAKCANFAFMTRISQRNYKRGLKEALNPDAPGNVVHKLKERYYHNMEERQKQRKINAATSSN
jgi:hypothetical protein